MTTKLYELKRKTKFKLLEDPSAPPDALPALAGEILTLNNIDGMYSRCYNEDGDHFFIAAGTGVEVCE